MGSVGKIVEVGIMTPGNPASGDLFPSIARCQGPGEALAVMGEGRGVISTRGPKPGEEKAEAGESEPAVWRPADRTERTLPLRPTVLEVEMTDSLDSALVGDR